MDEQLYDEFGNYIGPELSESESEDDDDQLDVDDGSVESGEGGAALAALDGQALAEYGARPGEGAEAVSAAAAEEDAIVLHEDKQYYPDAEAVYGEGVETVVLDEDAQDVNEPIIAPIRRKTFSVLEAEAPETVYEPSFLCSLTAAPALIRNVALVGHLHHGKTLFSDLLISHTHAREWRSEGDVRYTDTRKDEQDRELSVKATPVSLVLQSTRGKSYLINLLDCPGHTNFTDESCAALRAADGVVLLVDALEGVMAQTERLIRMAVAERLPLVLVLNKVDRLILELKMPPQDAYYKLLHTIEEVNEIAGSAAAAAGLADAPRLSPVSGSVIFASAQHHWSFSLHSFAAMYAARHPDSGLDASALARRLWGSAYFDEEAGRFTKKPLHAAQQRSFVALVLEPLYKIYTHVVGEDAPRLKPFLAEMGISLRKRDLNMNSRPLLRLVLRSFFGAPEGFVDALVRHVPSALDAGAQKARACFDGDLDAPDSALGRGVDSCDPRGPLLMNVVKLYATPEGDRFHALARIYSGSVAKGQRVRVIGEGAGEQDDLPTCAVEAVAIPGGRYSTEVDRLGAGNWALLAGVDATIEKTATIAGADAACGAFAPLRHLDTPVVRLSVEPLKPSELPRMVEGLRCVSKTYPSCRTKVEESGEHVICATGELALDCIMHDLREVYAQIEVRFTAAGAAAAREGGGGGERKARGSQHTHRRHLNPCACRPITTGERKLRPRRAPPPPQGGALSAAAHNAEACPASESRAGR